MFIMLKKKEKTSQNLMRIINNFGVSNPTFSNKFTICQRYPKGLKYFYSKKQFGNV